MKANALIHCQKHVIGVVIRFSCVSLLLAVTALRVVPQEAPPLALAPGIPAGSYALSDIDTINLFSGRVNVHLPLLTLAGRGAGSRQLSFTIDAPAPWKVTSSFDPNGNPFSYVEPGMSSDGIHMAVYSMRSETSGSGAQQCWTGYPEEYWKWTTTITRFFLIEPDGTEHEMRDAAFNGQPLADSPNNCPLGPTFAGPSRGKIFKSTDGFGATLIFDQDVRDGIRMDSPWPVGGGSGSLLLKDGTRAGGFIDRNGNKIDFAVAGANSGAVMVDPLNRTINWEGQLDAAPCAALVGGNPLGCTGYSQRGFGGTMRKIWLAYDQDQRTSAILLPNNQRYSFSYNQYGDVTRIDLPTGGSIEYDYEAGLDGDQSAGCGQTQGCIPGTYSDGVYRRVVARRVFREGNVLETRQTFSKPGNTNLSNVGYVEKKQYDANDHLLSSERHYFYGMAEASFVSGVNYVSWRSGHEYRSEFYDANGTLVRKKEITWAQREGGVGWWTGNQDDAPQNDPRIATEVTYLENGLSSTIGYGYDPTVSYNSLTDVFVYDFNGSLLRHTQTTYLKILNGIDYAGSNIQNGSSLHIRDFPSQVSVFDDTKELSRTTYEYDNYATDANHAGLVARDNISGLDSSYTTSYTTRGNVTGTTSYLLDNGLVVGSASSYAQYDVAGNVVKTIDPRGFATTLEYDDHFGTPDGEVIGNAVPSELSTPTPSQSTYAFVTKVTDAANHNTFAQFDYYLGQAVDAENANGVVSSAFFTDVLDRPTQVIRAINQLAPIKSQSTFSYDDVNRIVTATADLSSYNDNSLKSQTIYDGLGRAVENRTYENSTRFIAVKTIPFVVLQDPDTSAWSQATQASNPFRPYLGEQPIWSTSYIDSLGRMSKVRTPDSAILRTYYDGARTLAVDPIGKERLSLTNALGELKDVWEITPADGETEAVSFPGRAEVTAGYHTSYEYDAINHLTKVIQGTLSQRVFSYNTLGRLVSVSNPENGTISYQYDLAGNVIVKTDARGVSTHYSYDGLSRPVRRWYNASSSTGSLTQNSPALPTGVAVSDEANYFYDSQNLPAGAPNFTRGPSLGRLVATTYGTGSSAGDYYGYDAGGRAVLKIQQTGAINYQIMADYNVSARITSGVYPSGHAVSYAYDGAGRPLSFTGNLGDGTQRNYTTGMIYSALGGLSQEQFGTATPIYNKLFYNVRGQLAEIREGTTPNNTNWERGALINFYSTCWGMCAGQPMPDNNGNLKRQEHWVQDSSGNVIAVNSQDFEYDSLNRIKRVSEGTAWQQQFTYDRYGNRRVDINNTTASLMPMAFEVQSTTNRLLAPGDSSLAEINRQMRYDAAGNLTTDNYTGQGQRIFDAENHMTQAWANGQWQVYAYDAGGQRVRRSVNGVETWQVYGFGGELLTEYAANANPNTPQKEYGYRNGQLLVTAGTGAATAPAPSTLAAAPSSGGGNVILSWSAASGATNYRVERKGAAGSFVLAGTTASTGLTDTGVSAGSAYLYRVCAANVQGNCTSVFSNIALGAAISFPTDPTITSIADDSSGVNVTTVKAAHITELRTAVNAVRTLAGLAAGQWTNQTLTATVSIISADDVRDLRTKLDEALTALGIQISTYDDPTLAGAPNGTLIKKVHITQLRQRATSGTGGAGGSSSNQFGVQWLVADQLGTPRMIFDETGALANVKRHDYLPFGEDLVAGARATTPGYNAADGVRQKFTDYEHDDETKLEFAHARDYSSTQGRFTGVDPVGGQLSDPQSLNKYAYVGNNPVNITDPTGMNYFIGGGVNDPDIREFRVDGMLAFEGVANTLLGSGAAVEGPLSSARFNQSANMGQGEWQFFRAYASGHSGWYNMSGISININAWVNGEFAGNAYYGSGGFMFGSAAGGNSGFDFGKEVICGPPCTYLDRAKRGHSSVNLSIYNFTTGTMHDDQSDNDYVILGANGGVPAVGSFGFTQAEGSVAPGLYVTGQVALGGPGYTAGGNIFHMRESFFHEWNLSSPTANISIFLAIPQNRNLGASYPHTWEGVMNRRFNPGPGGRPAH